MRQLWDSVVRTFTPIIVGAVISWFITRGIVLDPEFERNLTIVITAVAGAIYYVVGRLLELYVAPRFGWLLGLAKQPIYLKREVPDAGH